MPRDFHPLLRTIGLTIRSLRRERGLSQETLAALADIDRSYMSSIERGRRNLSVLNVAKIAAALDVAPRDLLGLREVVRPMAALEGPGCQPLLPVAPDWQLGCYLSLG